jgi:hypothetical protein
VSYGVVSSNFDTGSLGHGSTRAHVLELEQRLNHLKREHEVCAMRIKKDVSGNAPQGYYYNWAPVRGIESRFNLMQSDYEMRFSRLLGEILRCKGRISNYLSCNSNDLTGGPLSTSRYYDDRATEGVSPLTSDKYAGEPRDIHGGHLVTNNSTEYLYFPDRPPTASEPHGIPGDHIVAQNTEYLYFLDQPLTQIDFDTQHGVHDTRGNGSGHPSG